MLVRKSLYEFHKTGDPLGALGLGYRKLYDDLVSKSKEYSFYEDPIINTDEKTLKIHITFFIEDEIKNISRADWSQYDIYEPFKTTLDIYINVIEETIKSSVYIYNADIPELQEEYDLEEDDNSLKSMGIETAEEILSYVDESVQNLHMATIQFMDDCWEYIKKERSTEPEYLSNLDDD